MTDLDTAATENGSPQAMFLKSLTVLYVEDDFEVREDLARYMRRRFARVDVAENGAGGLELFEAGHYDVVVTDIKMPVMDGLDMATRIKQITEETPVIVVTAYNETDYFMRAIEIGIDRYVKKPVDPAQLIQAITKATRVRAKQRELEHARAQTLEALTQGIAALARAIEKRDPYTDGHQRRVARLGVALAKRLGLDRDQVNAVRLGGLVHDVGKIAIPVELLSMPRPLSAIEYSLVKVHPSAGAEILGEVEFPWPITAIVLQHHERLDGSGYPDGLTAGAICVEARVVAVADVFEAMSSHRPYRAALGIDRAVEEILRNSGSLYDPDVVKCCVELAHSGHIAELFTPDRSD